MPGNRCSQSELFHIATFANEIAYGVAVRDVGHCLMDDWPLVEIGGRIVGSGSDEFNASLVSLVVGFGSGESR